MKTIIENFMILDDTKSHWIHAIVESFVEYLCTVNKDLDNNGTVDEFDYEIYLSNKVEHLDHNQGNYNV